MTTRIGLISDPHASPVPLRQALKIFADAGVSHIICAGDIAGYFEALQPTIKLLVDSGCRCVAGNHDKSYLEHKPTSGPPEIRQFLQSLPANLEMTIEEKSIYVVHAEPPTLLHGGIKLLDQQGEIKPRQIQLWSSRLKDFAHDVLIVGHTHQVFAETICDTFVINPGSAQFNHSCMVLTLPEMVVQTFALENRDIEKCWNFSMLFSNRSNSYPPRDLD